MASPSALLGCSGGGVVLARTRRAAHSTGSLVQVHAVAVYQVQKRWYTPPSRNTWSKQHHRIRTPRPLVDRFDLSRIQPQKEWWRERRVAPATFFGFPDVNKIGLRGGSLYVEQMDSVTLAVLADKCLKENIWEPDIWGRFSWRAQQISSRTNEPDLCYIFRAFARRDWFDQNLITTLLGRLHRRLYHFQLLDVTVLLEAFANRKFRQSAYLPRALTHLTLLLQHRDDAAPTDLARTCAALRDLKPLPRQTSRDVVAALELLAEALLLRDLDDLGVGRSIKILDCYVAWGLTSRERMGRSNAATDLSWALVRDMKGKLREHGKEHPDELSALAFALGNGGIDHDEVWEELTHNLLHEAHRLSGSAAAIAVYSCGRNGRCPITLYEALERRIRDQSHLLNGLDCARAAGGFLRGPRYLAERAVLQGPICDRTLELGLDAFDGEALTMMLEALAHAPQNASGVEVLAAAVLETLHAGGRLGELTARQLASVSKSLTRLQPHPDILCAILDRAHAALLEAEQEAIATEGSVLESDPALEADSVSEASDPLAPLAPRHVAMLCRGIAGHPAGLLPDAPQRLEALLPQLQEALAEQPAAVTVASLLGSLGQCPASESRSNALATCSERLIAKACDLPAYALVILSEDVAAFCRAQDGAWIPPAALVREVSSQLDMKRYDLSPGVMWRAARALETIASKTSGESYSLRLEKRDQPEVAKQ